jgi:hypothetical protein
MDTTDIIKPPVNNLCLFRLLHTPPGGTDTESADMCTQAFLLYQKEIPHARGKMGKFAKSNGEQFRNRMGKWEVRKE